MEIKDKLDVDQNGSPVDAMKYRIVHANLEAPQEEADYAGCKDHLKEYFRWSSILRRKSLVAVPSEPRLYGCQYDKPEYVSTISRRCAEGELFGNSGNSQCVLNDFSDTLIDFYQMVLWIFMAIPQRPTNCCFSRSYKAVKVRIRRRCCSLILAESRIKTSCSIDKDKYMMKAQARVSKSSAISDVQALPQKNIFDKFPDTNKDIFYK
ncbi:hypothetical protein Tco_1406833 [Tanacetum coccineum]